VVSPEERARYQELLKTINAGKAKFTLANLEKIRSMRISFRDAYEECFAFNGTIGQLSAQVQQMASAADVAVCRTTGMQEYTKAREALAAGISNKSIPTMEAMSLKTTEASRLAGPAAALKNADLARCDGFRSAVGAWRESIAKAAR
jgi:hypothetical protein